MAITKEVKDSVIDSLRNNKEYVSGGMSALKLHKFILKKIFPSDNKIGLFKSDKSLMRHITLTYGYAPSYIIGRVFGEIEAAAKINAFPVELMNAGGDIKTPTETHEVKSTASLKTDHTFMITGRQLKKDDTKTVIFNFVSQGFMRQIEKKILKIVERANYYFKFEGKKLFINGVEVPTTAI